ncbi:hypothetical protein [Sphingomonas sp.]|uniref:hypothetical protein n=1 Tax=Sphingomonas sp. TaxID=28214 RepID=UPI002B8B4576|nr:hypothetical protein [Sphingomonas sp.]HWK36589.1 hypothetical protein [Sphingomonas sp.]
MGRWVAVRALAGLTGLMAPMAASAQDMTVRDFLAHATALQSRGAAAADAPEYQRLKDEVAHATAAYRAMLATDAQAGTPPHSCPPPKGALRLTSKDLFADFRTIPPEQRELTVREAFYAFMKRRYPCAK